MADTNLGKVEFALEPGSRRPLLRPRFASLSLVKKQGAKAEPSADRNVALKPASDIVAGALARAASQSTIHPLDTLKVRMQTAKKAPLSGISKIGQLVPPVIKPSKVKNAVMQ
eukprot:scaffold58683_cov46-Prasinocladus_malaysianus.AAC.2